MQPDPLLDHRSETLLAVSKNGIADGSRQIAVCYAAGRFTAAERLGKRAGIQAA